MMRQNHTSSAPSGHFEGKALMVTNTMEVDGCGVNRSLITDH